MGSSERGYDGVDIFDTVPSQRAEVIRHSSEVALTSLTPSLRGLVRIESREHERELATHFTTIEVSLEHASTRWDERPVEKRSELGVVGTIASATVYD